MRRIVWIAAILVAVTAGAAWAAHSRFSDVNHDHPVEAIEWAADQEITVGYEDGTFRPDEPLQRQHARVFVERFYDKVLGADGDDQFSNLGFTRADMMELLYGMGGEDSETPTTTVVTAAENPAAVLVDWYQFEDWTGITHAFKFRTDVDCSDRWTIYVYLLGDLDRRTGDYSLEIARDRGGVGSDMTVEVPWRSGTPVQGYEIEVTCRA